MSEDAVTQEGQSQEQTHLAIMSSPHRDTGELMTMTACRKEFGGPNLPKGKTTGKPAETDCPDCRDANLTALVDEQFEASQRMMIMAAEAAYAITSEGGPMAMTFGPGSSESDIITDDPQGVMNDRYDAPTVDLDGREPQTFRGSYMGDQYTRLVRERAKTCIIGEDRGQQPGDTYVIEGGAPDGGPLPLLVTWVDRDLAWCGLQDGYVILSLHPPKEITA